MVRVRVRVRVGVGALHAPAQRELCEDVDDPEEVNLG